MAKYNIYFTSDFNYGEQKVSLYFTSDVKAIEFINAQIALNPDSNIGQCTLDDGRFYYGRKVNGILFSEFGAE